MIKFDVVVEMSGETLICETVIRLVCSGEDTVIEAKIYLLEKYSRV